MFQYIFLLFYDRLANYQWFARFQACRHCSAFITINTVILLVLVNSLIDYECYTASVSYPS